ncbi:hypothetical protein [Streptomyces sp. NPDC051218]|uniref:hypothetical protein n=1 Tax=Streptomyces sp. NPDC051218 TaxID=3365645 RepID=UPI0037B846D6
MTGTGLSFELQLAEASRAFWWEGVVGGLGAVELASPDRDAVPQKYWGTYNGATVRGESIPQCSYYGLGYFLKPRLAHGVLHVAGQEAAVSRNAWSSTKRGRALRIRALGRDYRYVEGQNKRQHALERDGVKVQMTRSSWKNPKTLSGLAEGSVDSVDISLAILFEGIYTRNLSLRGAVFSGPGRMLSRIE